tara:strand:+ start:268 stop:441 length:174 start_codon:yes stop_codon:yes gene_type:complete
MTIKKQEIKELKISEIQTIVLQIILGRWISNNKWDKDKAKMARNFLRQLEDLRFKQN